MDGTVKQFCEWLNEMRKIYPFDDEKTRIRAFNFTNNVNNSLQISTIDEKTGIHIFMSKDIEAENE